MATTIIAVTEKTRADALAIGEFLGHNGARMLSVCARPAATWEAAALPAGGWCRLAAGDSEVSAGSKGSPRKCTPHNKAFWVKKNPTSLAGRPRKTPSRLFLEIMG